uniref:Uncharacterized protein n=1 Tax=Romanomermis culicivorax TaxID=13658 RepID=A0A915ICQ2_ROMCU
MDSSLLKNTRKSSNICRG